jgi:hypothetical protein
VRNYDTKVKLFGSMQRCSASAPNFPRSPTQSHETVVPAHAPQTPAQVLVKSRSSPINKFCAASAPHLQAPRRFLDQVPAPRTLIPPMLTIAHCKTYWFSESIQSKVLSEASTILKVMALQST